MSNNLHENKRLRFLINVAFYAVILGIVILFFRYVFGLVLPFLLGFFIALIVDPAVRMLKKRARIPRALGSVLCVLLFVGLICVILYGILSRFVAEAVSLANLLPDLFSQIGALIAQLMDWLAGVVDTFPVEVATFVGSMLDGLTSTGAGIATWAVGWLTSFAAGLPSFFMFVCIMLVAACFTSIDLNRIKEFLYHQVPERYKSAFFEARSYLTRTVFRIGKAYLIIMSVTFLELFIGLTVLGVDYAVTLALLIAIVDIMPILGTGTVLIPWTAYSLFTGNITYGIVLAVVYGVITVVRQVLEPRIVGRQTGLYPLLTLMTMYIGLNVMGVGGIFLFPIIMIFIVYMHDMGRIHIWK